MRKITAAMIGALSGTAVMSVLIAAGIYQAVFYMSDERKSRHWQLPEGRQFKRYHKAIRKLTAEAEAVPFEPVRITSRDGLELFGRYYHIADGAPLIMLFHGYGGYVLRDLAGVHKIARENGINILAADERAGGRSEGHTTTFGVRERYDVLDWLAWADRRFGRKLDGSGHRVHGGGIGAAGECKRCHRGLPVYLSEGFYPQVREGSEDPCRPDLESDTAGDAPARPDRPDPCVGGGSRAARESAASGASR